MKQCIENVVQANGGFITKDEITTNWMYKRLLKSVKDGSLMRVRRGVFALPESMANTMYDIEKIVPGGVICSYSAWAYHNLTTQIPDAIYVAIKRNRRIQIPLHLPITLCRINEATFELGMVQREISGYLCNVYDLERSVCDAVKSRKKIGMDVCSEILDTALRRKGISVTRLMEYARKLRIETTMKKYLEVKL